MLRVLVTGVKGFIGSNLAEWLDREPDIQVVGFDVDDSLESLAEAAKEVEVVFHLAGANRPIKVEEFRSVNVDLTQYLCESLKINLKKPKVIFTSSIQATSNNDYGRSKMEAEEVLRCFAGETMCEVAIFRLPNVFGKWCRPNYNSVVATFCHNVARNLPITINDPSTELHLVYIDDVMRSFIDEIRVCDDGFHYREVPLTYNCTVGTLAGYIHSFREMRVTPDIPDFSDKFIKKLYATYLSYVPELELSYPLASRTDPRGVLAEFVRSASGGQVFVSRTKPGITRGGHYHDTKTEKFLVVEGAGLVKMRRIYSEEVSEFLCSGTELVVVDIPPGVTHSITNVGDGELVTLFWASEPFNPDEPDTYQCEVSK